MTDLDTYPTPAEVRAAWLKYAQAWMLQAQFMDLMFKIADGIPGLPDQLLEANKVTSRLHRLYVELVELLDTLPSVENGWAPEYGEEAGDGCDLAVTDPAASQ